MRSSSANKLDEIYIDLRQDILKGKWKVGDRLPTDVEMAGRFGCSVGTANKAVALLVHDGLVERRPGMGTRVTAPPKPVDSVPQLNAYAFIYSSERHEGTAERIRGFQEEAGLSKQRTMMLPTEADFHRELEFLTRLAEFDVRGAVVSPVVTTPKDQLNACEALSKSKIPIVLMGLNFPGYSASAVSVDNFDAGWTTTRYLLAQGVRKIGFFANLTWAQSIRDRYAGYRRAMDEAGVEVRPEWSGLEKQMHVDFENPLREPIELASAYLQRATDVEAVVCTNDFLAAGMIEVAHRMGRSVPSSLRVCGMDGLSLAQQVQPTLTTYRIPYREMGHRAFQVLQALVTGQPNVPDEILLKGEMVIGASA